MGRNTVSVIGREMATTAKASAFSLQSLMMCLSFQAEKLPKRCLTRDTYFVIRGSRDSNSLFTYPTTNYKSLRIISLSADTIAASSISARMASYCDSLLEALCQSPIPGLTRLANTNRFRGAKPLIRATVG